jgi:heme-degrading monooxygenase HmoA
MTTTVIIMRFKVATGREAEFESFAAERAKATRGLAGLKQLYLLAPQSEAGYRLVSWWQDVADTEAWIRKESYAFMHDDKHAGLVVGTVPYEVATVVREW